MPETVPLCTDKRGCKLKGCPIECFAVRKRSGVTVLQSNGCDCLQVIGCTGYEENQETNIDKIDRFMDWYKSYKGFSYDVEVRLRGIFGDKP